MSLCLFCGQEAGYKKNKVKKTFCCKSCKGKWFYKNHKKTKEIIDKAIENKINFKQTRTRKRKTNEYIRFQKNGVRKYLHRYVVEKNIGRSLLSHEHIHHINNNPTDNRIENLMIVSSTEHGFIHKKFD